MNIINKASLIKFEEAFFILNQDNKLMEQELDQLLEGQESGDKRPIFLTVLCILTFVGSGFASLAAIFSLMFSGAMESTLQVSKNAMRNIDDNGILDMDFEQIMIWQKYMNLSAFLGALMCLTGALLMWRLKKLGYFIYIPGAIIPAIVGIIATKAMFSGAMSGLASIGGYLGLVFALVFVVLYGLNYKSLK